MCVSRIVGYNEEMSVVDAKVLKVTCCPRDQLLVKSETLTSSTPHVDERLGRTMTTRAVIGYCQVQLKTIIRSLTYLHN